MIQKIAIKKQIKGAHILYETTKFNTFRKRRITRNRKTSGRTENCNDDCHCTKNQKNQKTKKQK